MRNWWMQAAAACGTFFVLCSARAQISRETPLVQTLKKVRPSVVAIKRAYTSPRGHTKYSTGSGVIIDERGFIVTTAHVVASNRAVTVRLADGAELSGEVVKTFPANDLAIVRIQTKRKLQALAPAPVADLMEGEWVFAVGHPYGYSFTVTNGIISALGRELEMPNGPVLKGLIQTNTSINLGNSGGPLLNVNGELIGINVAVHNGAQGIAFAINAATVKQVLSKHLSSVQVAGVTHGLVCAERVTAPVGADRQRVVVAAVAAQTPAAGAGLQKGDEIRAVGLLPVANGFDVERALWGSRPGEQVPVRLVRGGKELTVTLTLARGAAGSRTAALDPATLRLPGTPAQGISQAADGNHKETTDYTDE